MVAEPNQRPLGNTGISVSSIGFGTWGIGGLTQGNSSYGATDDNMSLAALNYALDHGVTFLDTARAYGDGHAEELIATAIKDRPSSDYVISTKAGMPSFHEEPDFSEAGIRASIEHSLRQLRLERVDVLLLHSPPDDELHPESTSLRTLRALQDEGLIKTYGVSVKAPQQGVPLIRDAQIPVLQINLNMMDTRAFDCGLLHMAKANTTGLIARTPLCFGFLTGQVHENTAFGQGDHRSSWPPAQIKAWSQGAKRLHETIPALDGRTQTDTALRFCITPPEVATVIPGLMSVAEVQDAIQSATAPPLTAEQMEEIIDLNRQNLFFAR